MHKKTLLIALSVSFYLLHTSVQAEPSIEACQKKESTIEDHSKCLDIVKTHVERKLQTWVNNQVFVLESLGKKSGRFSPLTIFKRSQKDFISYRENNCKWQYLASTPSESAAVYKMCFILLSENRTKELSLLHIAEKNKKQHY